MLPDRPPAKASVRPAEQPSPPPADEIRAAPDQARGGVYAVQPGDEIAGYRLEEQIGMGGMAVVYRAHDERLDRRVALKLLASGLAADEGFRQRFIRESRAAAAVDHPHVIPIYEAGDAGGALFIAMRYVQGGDVRSLLARVGPLPAARAWAIINQVGAALDAAHASGLIHRDVKPANMLLDARASASPRGLSPGHQPEHVYLSDFGISKLSLSTSHLTSTGQFVGTLDYIAPEQITGRDVDGRADLYSLGCAAFELLTGSPPFRRDEGFALISAHLTEPPPSLTERRDDLPAAVDLVLAGAMAKTPGKRYETCERFTTDLGRALGLIPGYLELPGSPRSIPLAGPDTQGPQDQPGTPLAIPTALGAYGTSSRPAERPGGVAAQRQQAAPDRTWPSGTDGPIAPYPASRSAAASARRPPGSPGAPAGQASSGWPPQPSGPGGIMGWDPRTQQAPARRSRAKIAGIGIAVAAAVAAAVTAAVILLGGHHNTPSGLVAPPHTSSASSTTPSPSASSSTPSVTTSPSPAGSQATTTPPPATVAPAASTQAAAVNTAVAAGSGRSVTLTNAVDNVGACTDVPGSIDVINSVRAQRQTEYNRAQKLATDALQDGALLKSDLTNALSFALKADDDYLAWAQQRVVSCQPASQPADAKAESAQSSSYKALFVGLWNPQAVAYGFPARTVADI